VLLVGKSLGHGKLLIKPLFRREVVEGSEGYENKGRDGGMVSYRTSLRVLLSLVYEGEHAGQSYSFEGYGETSQARSAYR
jgi:hypothetical protein